MSRPENSVPDSNDFISGENNWDGCHTDHALPCYKNEMACSVSLTALGGGKRFQLDSNGIPDHNSWALTGRTSVISEDSSNSTLNVTLNLTLIRRALIIKLAKAK